MQKSISLTEIVWNALPDNSECAFGYEKIAEAIRLPWNKSTGNRIRSAVYRLKNSGRAYSIGEGSPLVRWYREKDETMAVVPEIRYSVVNAVKSGGTWNVPRLAAQLGYLRRPVAKVVHDLVAENVLHWQMDWLVFTQGERL